MKQAGYALFSTTPSERAAIGLTEDQTRVHLLERTGDGWRVVRDWPIEEHSHTELMVRLRRRDGAGGRVVGACPMEKHPHTELMVRLGRVDEPTSTDELVRLALGS